MRTSKRAVSHRTVGSHCRAAAPVADEVVAAFAQRIPLPDGDRPVAGIAHHLHAADHAPANQMPVVEAVLCDDIVVEPLQVFVGQQLAGKKTRTAQAL